MEKVPVCGSMAGATFVVVSCLVAGIIISQDINLMYDDFMISMGEFRSVSEDTWIEIFAMQLSTANGGNSKAPSLAALVGRRMKRVSVFDDSCTCGFSALDCPHGPPGPPGIAGPPGDIGRDGPPGKAGKQGVLQPILFEKAPSTCKVCPVGPPGPPGKEGCEGPPGRDGRPGKRGFPGNSGRLGMPGPVGDQGMQGLDGQPGMPGGPGQDVLTGKGEQGFPGRSGPQGEAGEPGWDGNDGKDGKPGREGPSGLEGMPGVKGNVGPSGYNGTPGAPGEDGEYCSCPEHEETPYYEKKSGYQVPGHGVQKGKKVPSYVHPPNLGSYNDLNEGYFHHSAPPVDKAFGNDEQPPTPPPFSEKVVEAVGGENSVEKPMPKAKEEPINDSAVQYRLRV